MGWVFVLMGVFLIGSGSFLVYYGQDLVRRRDTSPVISSAFTPVRPILTPPQEKLLTLLWRYQRDFAARKLIVSRDGALHVDEPERKNFEVNLLPELYNAKEADESRAREFETLMEQLPPEYLRQLPEARWDSPFVVNVTEAGVQYLRGQR